MTCRPKLLEKKVGWHADSWKPPKTLHKKEKMGILLPHADNLQTLLALSAPFSDMLAGQRLNDKWEGRTGYIWIYI